MEEDRKSILENVKLVRNEISSLKRKLRKKKI